LKSCKLSTLATKIPYHHSRSLDEVYGELYDRFGAKIEKRYSVDDINELYHGAGLAPRGNGQIHGMRGWVSWGNKI